MSTYTLPEHGKVIGSDDDARDIVGEALGAGAELVVIPVSRLAPEFFALSSGLAGAVLQKFTNYRLKVAIMGDISAHTARSAPLRNFVRESNRSGHVRFVSNHSEL